MTIQVIINCADKVGNELLQVPASLERAVLFRMSQVAYDEAQRGAGRHVKTGAMFQSLYNRSVPNGREVGHDPQRAPHAMFVQFGTRAHPIEGKPITPRRIYPKPPNKVFGGILRPYYTKTQKTLRWAAGGKFFFANRVQHPGYAGDAYMTRAADEAVRQFQPIVDAAWKESIA